MRLPTIRSGTVVRQEREKPGQHPLNPVGKVRDFNENWASKSSVNANHRFGKTIVSEWDYSCRSYDLAVGSRVKSEVSC